MDNVRYSYHVDPKNSKRVMTVVRCRVLRSESAGRYYTYLYAYAINDVKNDNFIKSIGRSIALARLEKHLLRDSTGPWGVDAGQGRGATFVPTQINVHEHGYGFNSNPIAYVMYALAGDPTNKCPTAKRIAFSELEHQVGYTGAKMDRANLLAKCSNLIQEAFKNKNKGKGKAK